MSTRRRPVVVIPPGIYPMDMLRMLYAGCRLYVGEGPMPLTKAKRQRRRIRRLMRGNR